MATKLTLTLDKTIISEAKKYAALHGRSLSEIVENYFKYLTSTESRLEEDVLSPRIQKLKGIMKVDQDFDYKKILSSEKQEKYEA